MPFLSVNSEYEQFTKINLLNNFYKFIKDHYPVKYVPTTRY